MLEKLNLPEYGTRIRQDAADRLNIFDPVRRKYVRLTAEEWVRQHMVNFLICHKGFPRGLIAIEAPLTYGRRKKRCDILVCSRQGIPVLIVECKAPAVEITQDVFDQIAMYNFNLNVQYLVVTNGIRHYACQMDLEAQSWRFLDGIPEYGLITGRPDVS